MSAVQSVNPTQGTLAWNYAPSAMGDSGAQAQQAAAEARRSDILTSASGLASVLTTPGGATPGNLLSSGGAVVAALMPSPGLQKLTAVGSAVNSIANDLGARSYVRVAPQTSGAILDESGQAWKEVRSPGSLFGALGTATGLAAQLTNNRQLGLVSQTASGVSSTLRASASVGGAAAGATTGLGAAFGVLGGMLKGGAAKVANVASVALNTAGNILSKATSLAGGLVGGISGIAGMLIGGDAGKRISAAGSVATGALLMAANPILGGLAMLGGMFGLFGKKNKTSKFSEQMAADFKGDGRQNDMMVRAAGGKNNNLEIRLTDEATGKDKAVQTIKIPGWFNSADQSRMAQTVDVTGDGKSDIVWQDGNRVSVFTNRGDGSMGSADYASLKADADSKSAELGDYSRLLAALGAKGGVAKRYNEKGKLMNPVDYEGWKPYYEAAGGKDKLGHLTSWVRDKRAEVGSISQMKARYDAEGGAAAHGSLLNYVSDRLASIGIAKPRALPEILARPADEVARIDAGLGVRGGVAADPPRAMGGMTRKARERQNNPERMAYAYRAGGGILGEQARRIVAAVDGNRIGTGSHNAKVDGSGVSMATQSFDVSIDKQKAGQLFFWDVNGDGSNDLVFGGESVQGIKAFLNRGDGVFDTDAIDMAQPTDDDIAQLALQDRLGRVFLNADFSGDGQQRLQAVLGARGWMQA